MSKFLILIANLKELGDKQQSSNHLNKDTLQMKNCKCYHFIEIPLAISCCMTAFAIIL